MMENGFAHPPPPPPARPPMVLPYIDSIYNQITRRIRAANTIFGDRVKLDLRQTDIDHRANLKLPYLLVVPQQTQAARRINRDQGTMINPRAVRLIGQFDGRGSEHEYLAANDIETAERQLIYVLASWSPPGTSNSSYGQDATPPVAYGGMRIQSTRAPDVVAVYQFLLNEVVVLPEELIIVDDDSLPEQLVLDGMAVHVIDPCCIPCPPEEGPGPNIAVAPGGGCPVDSEPDPCEPPCPPIVGGDPHADDTGRG